MIGRKKQKGFTIIELLVATTVFSVVLVIALAGVLRITQLYYKGITASRTQDVARTLMDDLSESIRFSNSAIQLPASAPIGPEIAVGDTDTGYFCIGSKRYTYAIDRQLKSESPDSNFKEKRHALWVDVPEGGCTGPANLNDEIPSGNNDNGREILGENMRLARLELIREDVLGREAYTINISVAYGDHAEPNVSGGSPYGGALATTADGNSRTCQSTNSPFVGQFCHVSSTSVTVERRLQ